MKSALLTLAILVGCRLSAQDKPGCAQKLDTLITMVSHDYAGYYDKVFAGDRSRYQQFVDSLRTVADTTVTAHACSELLDTYCAYFKDKQLMIFRSPELLSKSNTVDPRPLTTVWTADSLRNYFVGRGNDLHELEGIWNFGTHELGLIYVDTANHYQAVTLRSPYPHWNEGMVKFTLVPAGIDSVQLDYWPVLGCEFAGEVVVVGSSAKAAAG